MSPEKTGDGPPVCDYEGSDYQTSFWDRSDRAYEDNVEAIALRRLLPPAGDMLLEIGVGAGRHTPRYTGFKRIVLLDYSRTQLEQAQKRLGSPNHLLYVLANAYQLPFEPGLFDTLTMIRVLHHMADAPGAIRELRRVLRVQGSLILEFANKRNLKAMLRHALGRQAWSPYSREPIEFAVLNFNFHPAEIRDWLEGAQFTIERKLTVSHFRLNILKRIVPLPLLVSLDALAQYSGNWWQISPSVFLRARAIGAGEQPAAGAFFRCPKCSTPIPGDPFDARGTALDLSCPGCGHKWAYRAGIFDFKV